MLATDLNNREFQGAQDPDSLLSVRFYEDAFQNEFQTKQQNRPVFDNVVMIEICTPGSILNIINRPAVAADKIKFKRQWDYFEATHMSGERMQSGTPLAQWPLLNKAQAEMLRAIKFFSVEQIAGASDEQLQNLGMHGGMQPMALRDKARAFLNVAKNASYADEAAQELKKRDEELAAIKAQAEADKAEMQRQMAEMKQMLEAATTQQNAPEPQRRKRRTKAEMEAARA